MDEDKKWAANIAFTGDEDTVKKIIAFVEKLEGEGKIEDYTWIDGPHQSLQELLKRRAVNLALEVGTPKALSQTNPETQHEDDGGNSGDVNE